VNTIRRRINISRSKDSESLRFLVASRCQLVDCVPEEISNGNGRRQVTFAVRMR
jgi:hypothetical protein